MTVRRRAPRSVRVAAALLALNGALLAPGVVLLLVVACGTWSAASALR